MARSGADFSFETLLHTGHFTREPSGMALPVIDLDRTGNATTVSFHTLVAPSDDTQDVVPLAFEHGAHRVQPIIHSAFVDDVQRASHIFSDALTFAKG